MRIIIIDNPSETVLHVLLAHGAVQVPKEVLKLARPSTKKDPLPYIPTPEELEAVNDPKALEGETFEPQLTAQAFVRKHLPELLKDITVPGRQVIEGLHKMRLASGGTESYKSFYSSTHIASAKMGVKKGSRGWAMPID